MYSEEYKINQQEWIALAKRNIKKLEERGPVGHWADVEGMVKRVRLALDNYENSIAEIDKYKSN